MANRKSGATGPKVSSRAMVICGVMSARMVGSKKVPPRAWRLPPTTTRAPLAVASAMCSSTFSTAAMSISGPCSAPGSKPFATLRPDTAWDSRAAKSS